jgi:hypothetical protein
VELGLAVQTEGHRSTAIKDHDHLQTRLLNVLLDEVAIALPENLPIDQPDFITRHVASVLGKLGAPAFQLRAMFSSEQSVHDTTGEKFEPFESRQVLRIENVRHSRKSCHGSVRFVAAADGLPL